MSIVVQSARNKKSKMQDIARPNWMLPRLAIDLCSMSLHRSEPSAIQTVSLLLQVTGAARRKAICWFPAQPVQTSHRVTGAPAWVLGGARKYLTGCLAWHVRSCACKKSLWMFVVLCFFSFLPFLPFKLRKESESLTANWRSGRFRKLGPLGHLVLALVASADLSSLSMEIWWNMWNWIGYNRIEPIAGTWEQGWTRHNKAPLVARSGPVFVFSFVIAFVFVLRDYIFIFSYTE